MSMSCTLCWKEGVQCLDLPVGQWLASVQVLVHAGTGGVGLAAVQVAQAMGAAVVATAGSAAKRALLRQMGVTAAAGSRDTEFASTLAPLGTP